MLPHRYKGAGRWEKWRCREGDEVGREQKTPGEDMMSQLQVAHR